MTKKCARCDSEYDDAYDGCPACARADVAVGAARLTSASASDYGPGSAIGALLSFAAAILLSFVLVFLPGALSPSFNLNDGLVLASLLNGIVWAVVVLVDYGNLKKPVAANHKILGTAGTSQAVWAIAAFLAAGIAVPMYFYQRPRIRRAFEIGHAAAA